MLNVSRTTIRSALQILERDGIVTRRRAIGTIINSHVPAGTLALQRLHDWEWFLRLASKGREIDRQVDWDRCEIPMIFVQSFGLVEHDECIYVERAYIVDRAVVLQSRAIVLAVNLNEEEIVEPFPDLITDFSDRYCHKPILHSVVRINAIAFSTPGGGMTRLEPRAGGAFTRLHERLYAMDGDIIGYGILDIDDQFLELEVFRRRDA